MQHVKITPREDGHGLATWAAPRVQPPTSMPRRLAALLRPLWSSRLARLLVVIGWVGLIPSGGKVNVMLQQELVRRRGWLSRDEFAEGYALSKLLPGSTGVNQVLFIGHSLHGRPAAALCGLALVLPGLAGALLLSALFLGQTLPGWLAGALQGLVAAYVGLHASNLLSLLPAARSARLWPAFTLAAFVATAVAGLDLLIVLLPLLALALLLNRPRRKREGTRC